VNDSKIRRGGMGVGNSEEERSSGFAI